MLILAIITFVLAAIIVALLAVMLAANVFDGYRADLIAWWRRVARRWQRRRSLIWHILTEYAEQRGGTAGGILLIAVAFFLTWIGLIISCR